MSPPVIEVRYNGTDLDGDLDIKLEGHEHAIKVVGGKFMLRADWEDWQAVGITHASRFFSVLGWLLSLELGFTDKQVRKIEKWWKSTLESPQADG